MLEVRFLPPAVNFIKKIKDKKLKSLYHNVVVVMAGTRENFYDELKRYMKK